MPVFAFVAFAKTQIQNANVREKKADQLFTGWIEYVRDITDIEIVDTKLFDTLESNMSYFVVVSFVSFAYEILMKWKKWHFNWKIHN